MLRREFAEEGYLVVRLESLNIRHLGALRVKIKLVELLHPLHNLLILRLGEIVIVTTSVPWVARVKSERKAYVCQSTWKIFKN